MLDKEKLLKDLIEMKKRDEKKLEKDDISFSEICTLEGSIINLDSIIHCINQGTYDIKAH